MKSEFIKAADGQMRHPFKWSVRILSGIDIDKQYVFDNLESARAFHIQEFDHGIICTIVAPLFGEV